MCLISSKPLKILKTSIKSPRNLLVSSGIICGAGVFLGDYILIANHDPIPKGHAPASPNFLGPPIPTPKLIDLERRSFDGIMITHVGDQGESREYLSITTAPDLRGWVVPASAPQDFLDLLYTRSHSMRNRLTATRFCMVINRYVRKMFT